MRRGYLRRATVLACLSLIGMILMAAYGGLSNALADPSPSPSDTPSPSPSPTPSPSSSPSPTGTPSPSPSDTRSPKPTVSPSPKATESPRQSPSPRRHHRAKGSLHKRKPHRAVEGRGCRASPPPVGLGVEHSPYLPGEPPGMQGPQSTDALQALLGVASSRRHVPLARLFLQVAGPFPLAGPAHWSNDWHAYRPCPYPHVHEGVDLIAPRGTPIVAVADAIVTQVIRDPEMSGLGIEISDASGTQYFYAHMERFAPGLRVGLRVRIGQVIGFVGNTGDAAGGPTHLHFEVQPQGVPVPPKPYVDRWLLGALARARSLARQGPGHLRPRLPALLPDRTAPPSGSPADLVPIGTTTSRTAVSADARHSARGVLRLAAIVLVMASVAFWTGVVGRRTRTPRRDGLLHVRPSGEPSLLGSALGHWNEAPPRPDLPSRVPAGDMSPL